MTVISLVILQALTYCCIVWVGHSSLFWYTDGCVW